MRGYPLKLPFWSGGGAAYSHKVSLFEPIPLTSALVLYEIGARINAAAEIKEHLAVRTLPAAYKENRGVGEKTSEDGTFHGKDPEKIRTIVTMVHD